MTRQEELLNLGGVYDDLFALREFPEFVFKPAVRSCAWLAFDVLCSAQGWALLSALAQLHGDGAVHAVGVDLAEPQRLTLAVASDPDQHGAMCDDELVAATLVRWWDSSGRWGIQGSRDIEIAVVGQLGDVPWPRRAECDVLSIDAALRLARGTDDMRSQLLTAYDAVSWDPASGDQGAVPELIELCRDVQANRVDPVVAIRGFVGLLERVPKSIRRIATTEQLHKAWTRTHYLLLGEDRAPFGGATLGAERPQPRTAFERRASIRSSGRRGDPRRCRSHCARLT